jgi:hypothetical protein
MTAIFALGLAIICGAPWYVYVIGLLCILLDYSA